MTGVFLAMIAMVGWGLADFFVQKATRKVGVVTTLFAGSVFGLLILTPFTYGEFALLAVPRNLIILAAYALIGLFTAFFSLEAFRKGKIAVIGPIMGIELPITILLAVIFLDERLAGAQIVPIIVVFFGIFMAMARQPSELFKKRNLERGAMLGVVGAISLGVGNFLTGVASQETAPLLTVWFGRAVFTAVFGAYLLFRGRFAASVRETRKNAALVFGVSALYLAAFVSYGIATTLIPVSIATTISENYIVLAALLGVFVNKEKLTRHQMLGAALAVGGLLVLAYTAA